MKKSQVLCAGIMIALAACNNNTTSTAAAKNDSGTLITTTATEKAAHTSKNSLDWAGVYEGILPCADCEGIKTTITLQANDSFSIKEEYLGKGKFEHKGIFQWDSTGNNVLLTTSGNRKYKVGENQLIALDQEGKVITGNLASHYILLKK